MPVSVETYPGQNLSISQLLHAFKQKLLGTSCAERVATMMGPVEVDLLEQGLSEALCLVRSTKNTFAPINKIPPEVFSLIAHQCDKEEDFISLTHVCQKWRQIAISCPSLWTNLDCEDINKTRAYLKRSKASPLKINLENSYFLDDAFCLTIPHFGRLENLSLFVDSEKFLELTKHLRSPAPFIKTLSLNVIDPMEFVLTDAIFGGDLSSLHKLTLDGVITNLAWENMSNLRKLYLRNIPSNKISMTRLLDFFERAPLLCEIKLRDALPNSSDAPLERVVPLPNLKSLAIHARQPHTILMNHLSIPAGALTSQGFFFGGTDSPIPFHLPETLENLKNISSITSIDLDLNSGVHLRLRGPSGGLIMHCEWASVTAIPIDKVYRVLRSLHLFRMSKVERLAISRWPYRPRQETIKSSLFQSFLLIGNLRTLALSNRANLPFITALNPQKNAPRVLIFPKLEELSMYIKETDCFYGEELLDMAEERTSRGAKLKAVVIVGPWEHAPAKEMSKLRVYVSHVEYRSDAPAWDTIPDDTGYDSDD